MSKASECVKQQDASNINCKTGMPVDLLSVPTECLALSVSLFIYCFCISLLSLFICLFRGECGDEHSGSCATELVTSLDHFFI
jgi:hypothetical protein